jgi:nitroreductase
MDVIEAIRRRHSVRVFKSDNVPRQTLREVLDAAVRSPSAMNTQPWQFAVVTGKTLAAMKDRNIALLKSGVEQSPDFPIPAFHGVYRRRQVEVYSRLLGMMRIAFEDRERRDQWLRHGFRFFEASAVIIIYADAELDVARTQFDIGLVTQSICLAALGYGLGSCVCLHAVSYPDMLRDVLGIGDDKKIAVGVALGYGEPEHPANRFTSSRESVRDIVRWYGFD